MWGRRREGRCSLRSSRRGNRILEIKNSRGGGEGREGVDCEVAERGIGTPEIKIQVGEEKGGKVFTAK
jgi:hypothetical protein